MLLGLFALLWLSSLLVPERPTPPGARQAPPLGRVLRRPVVIAFFAVCFLNQAAHGAYYGFYSLYLETLGYSREFIGLMWGLGVTVEVGMFVILPRLLSRFGPRRLMLAALALAALRWLLIGHFARDLPVLLFAQSLHAFSFGVFHAVSIHLIHQFFRGRCRDVVKPCTAVWALGSATRRAALPPVIYGWGWDRRRCSISRRSWAF